MIYYTEIYDSYVDNALKTLIHKHSYTYTFSYSAISSYVLSPLIVLYHPLLLISHILYIIQYFIGKITEDDSRVMSGRLVSIFPTNDQELFPPRKPRTCSWKMGLRQYNSRSSSSNINDVAIKSGDDEIDDGNYGKLASSSMQFKAMGKFKLASKNANKILIGGSSDKDNNKVEKIEKRARRPTNVSTKEMHQYLRDEYVTEELPLLSPRSSDKYFGDIAKDKFFSTYQQLKQRGQVCFDDDGADDDGDEDDGGGAADDDDDGGGNDDDDGGGDDDDHDDDDDDGSDDDDD